MTVDATVVSPAAEVLDQLADDGDTLALAESCTGGLLASMVTDVPGASGVLDRAVVAYTVDAKVEGLGVDRTLLDDPGPVSRPVAEAMAAGLREQAGSTWTVSTTGIAGPTGGTTETPVGTVFVGVAGPNDVQVSRHRFEGDRWTVKREAAKQALADLRQRSQAGRG